MLTRIVKMTFQPEEMESFSNNFEENKHKIRASKGCKGLEIFHDIKEPNVIFTVSRWDSEADLNAYKESDLFGKVWKKTKKLFSDKPEAWSLFTFERN